MALNPAHVAALGMGTLGLGLIVAAFMGEALGALRLVLGIVLLVAAFITSGLTLLARNAAPPREEA